MVLADLGIELARAIAASAAAGELPAAATSLTASGTWRPAPSQAGSAGPGSYRTALPFALAKLTGTAPGPVAARLAKRLAEAPWIVAARPSGTGHVTITVSAGHLAGLPARILAAGHLAAHSDALAASRLAAPELPDLTAAPNWDQAWRSLHSALVGRLTRAAGGEVIFLHSQQSSPQPSTAPGRPGPVSAAIAYFGSDAVRYVLARTAKPAPAAIELRLAARLDLANPLTLVGYAHADAASSLRWAADLGQAARGQHDGPAPGSAKPAPAAPDAMPLTTMPPELRLLEAISWLPERVAAAARRHRPAELTAQLEAIAAAWLDCRERCPALPFSGRGAPASVRAPLAIARLRLADATRVALAAGLSVLGVSAPVRL